MRRRMPNPVRPFDTMPPNIVDTVKCLFPFLQPSDSGPMVVPDDGVWPQPVR